MVWAWACSGTADGRPFFTYIDAWCAGVDQIRDDNVDTYWQSDGAQPHLINIQFHRKMSLLEVALYLDYNLDESYTPKKIAIKAGTTFHDLVEIQVVDLHEPMGWVKLSLVNPAAAAEQGQSKTDDEPAAAGRSSLLLRAHFLQICIIAMHQNGRDTHIRQAKVFGPRQSVTPLYMPAAVVDSAQGDEELLEPTTTDFTQFSTIR
jgi:anaphase-promoting complex subunit 10